MAKDLLTREELNMLLDDDTAADPRLALPSGPGPFSPEDFTSLQKVLATYLIPGVTAWSVLFGRSVELADPDISLISADVLTEMDGAVIGSVDFLQGVKGHARFVLPLDGARVLVGLALGSPEPPREFDLIHRSSFASVLKYLLAEMRSLISRGTGRRVGTSEPVVKLWPEEVLPESGHLVQAKIPWWVEGVSHPPLLFWADIELTRGLLGLAAPKPKTSMSPGESAWSGAAMKAKPAAGPPGGRLVPTPQGTLRQQPNNRIAGRAGMNRGEDISPPLQQPATPPPSSAQRQVSPRLAATPSRPGRTADDELSIWTLGRAKGQNPTDRSSTNEPESAAPAAPASAPASAPARQAPAPAPPAPPPVAQAPAVPLPAAPAPVAPTAAASWTSMSQPRMDVGATGSQNSAPAPQQAPEDQEMRVELGRATLRDPLTLGQVVPLDRLAGESVDIFVDGYLVARGEVTVDGEVLAVRVTQTVPTRRPSRGPER